MMLSRPGREGRTCSERGVLKTLSLPKRCNSPAVHLNTPPKLTSSPKTNALSRLQAVSQVDNKLEMRNKSSTTLYFLLFSKVIARASLTAVQRLIREVSDSSEPAAAVVDNPLKIKLQLCLLSALRPREQCNIISNRRRKVQSHCKPALARACSLIWDVGRARCSTASWYAGPHRCNCAAVDVDTDAVHHCLVKRGTIKCQGLWVLSQGSIQSACNISWSNQKSSMPGVLKQRRGPTLHRQLPGLGPVPAKHRGFRGAMSRSDRGGSEENSNTRL